MSDRPFIKKLPPAIRPKQKRPRELERHEITNLRVEPHMVWTLQFVDRERGALRTRWLSMSAEGYRPEKKLTKRQASMLSTLMLIGISSARSEYIGNRLPEDYLVKVEPHPDTFEIALLHGQSDSADLFRAVKAVLTVEDDRLMHHLAGTVLRRYLDNLDLVVDLPETGEAS